MLNSVQLNCTEFQSVEKLNSVAFVKENLPPIVEKLRRIAEDYMSNITLKEAAKKYGFNEKYLGRLFKKHMTLSFNEYRKYKGKN